MIGVKAFDNDYSSLDLSGVLMSLRQGEGGGGFGVLHFLLSSLNAEEKEASMGASGSPNLFGLLEEVPTLGSTRSTLHTPGRIWGEGSSIWEHSGWCVGVS